MLQALDLLPRTAFLGSILATRVHGAAQAVRLLTEEVEDLKLTLFPTDLFFDERSELAPKHRWVQPDGLLERRARPPSFWVFNDPGLYYLLVKIRGWPAERYREWVAASLQHELLGDR